MFSAVQHLWTLMRTGATFERTGALVAILDAVGIRGAPRFVLRALAMPLRPFGRRGDPALPPVARACQAMGPAYVKFGQILSTRPDVVGGEVVRQLRYLQDRLPPFPLAEARATLEDDLGFPVETLFTELGPPIAAASIAQVHPATWRADGRKVAVKVLRPDIRARFRRDIGSFYFIAGLIEAVVPGSERLRPKAVVGHFEGVVTAELDLRLEAAGANQFADNIRDDERLRVPEILWEGTGRRVMTMEWVDGLPVEPEALSEAGIDLAELGQRVIRIFLRHALRDGYFHGDMHQGNLRVGPDGTLILFDFGIMGRLDPVTRRHYAEILYGFLTRDYKRVAEVHFEAGYVPYDRDKEQFAQALRSIGEPIFGQDVSRISMARLLAQLFDITERFGMATRTELILLQRTMVVVEGVARSLDPRTNIWEAARPVVQEWISTNLGPVQAGRDLIETARILRRVGPRLPGLAEELLMLAEEARMRRRLAAEAPPPPREPSRWPWAVAGLAAGAGAVLLVTALG